MVCEACILFASAQGQTTRPWKEEANRESHMRVRGNQQKECIEYESNKIKNHAALHVTIRKFITSVAAENLHLEGVKSSNAQIHIYFDIDVSVIMKRRTKSIGKLSMLDQACKLHKQMYGVVEQVKYGHARSRIPQDIDFSLYYGTMSASTFLNK